VEPSKELSTNSAELLVEASRWVEMPLRTHDDVSVGDLARVLRNISAVLAACRKAGIEQESDPQRIDALGKIVKVLEVDPTHNTACCFVPSVGNVWFALEALAMVPQEEPEDSSWTEILRLDGHRSFDGGNFEDVPYSDRANPEASFSIRLSARCLGGKGYRSPMTSRDDKPSSGYLFYVDPDDRWAFWVGDGTHWAGILGPPVVQGAWTRLRGVHDVEAQVICFYVDGVMVGRRGGVDFMPNRKRPLRLGAGRSERDLPLFFFVGEVCDVAVLHPAPDIGNGAATRC